MMRWVFAAFIPLAACSVALGDSGVKGTGSGTARDFAVSDFTRVALTGSDNVRIRIGPQFGVHAVGPADVLDRLRIERNGDTLSIGRKSTMGFEWSNHDATITVTIPAIAGASVTGSGDMAVERVGGESFKGSATGSGNLNIAALDVKHGEFSVTGSGDIDASGKAAQLAMSVTGSGSLRLKGVQAQGASVSVMGSGDATASVNGPASVNVMGSGDVDLGANARCTTSKLGSGDVTCGR